MCQENTKLSQTLSEKSVIRIYVFFFPLRFPHFISCVRVFCLLCTAGVPGPCGGQQRALDPLDLQLQTDVRSHVGAGT